jgi:hypothetical protein
VIAGLGQTVQHWSFIERQLNTLVCNYHPYAPDRLRKNGLPSSLGEKIRYLVQVSKDERLPAELTQSIRSWVPDLDRLRKHRDWIVHGNLSQVGRSLRWKAQLLTLKGGGPVLEDRIFENDDLNERQREIFELSHRMAVVLNPIFFGENWRDGIARRALRDR